MILLISTYIKTLESPFLEPIGRYVFKLKDKLAMPGKFDAHERFVQGWFSVQRPARLPFLLEIAIL